MYINEQKLLEISVPIKTEFENICLIINLKGDALNEFLGQIENLLRAKKKQSIFVFKIDRWPMGELKAIFDKVKLGGADFGNTWIEIVVNFLEERVTIKRNSLSEPEVLYERKLLIEPVS